MQYCKVSPPRGKANALGAGAGRREADRKGGGDGMSSSGNMQNAAFEPMLVGLGAPPPEFDGAVVLANVGSDRLDGLAGNRRKAGA